MTVHNRNQIEHHDNHAFVWITGTLIILAILACAAYVVSPKYGTSAYSGSDSVSTAPTNSGTDNAANSTSNNETTTNQ